MYYLKLVSSSRSTCKTWLSMHGRTWKVADPILLAGSTNYRKLYSWRSFSRATETLMSKTTRYFFWYILGREVRVGSRRETSENARKLEAEIQWRILWLDFSSARNCQELGKAGSRVWSSDSRFKVPSNFRWVLTENSLFSMDPSENSWNTASGIIDLEWTIVMGMIHELDA